MIFQKKRELLISKPRVYLNLKSRMISNLLKIDRETVTLQLEYNWAADKSGNIALINKINKLIDRSWNTSLKKLVAKFKKIQKWTEDEVKYFSSSIIELQDKELSLFLNINNRNDNKRGLLKVKKQNSGLFNMSRSAA
ncbi:hypothetical protein [Mycoplasma bradburyae]|uniref:Uncharacterized protein n=1 Tax=Mycoplasma bradburyae TaxID=2963128 RepID=A0ABT5GAM0_9MOLU|nr:hypothetical protein [Mycoplasma bradburyae]MDC4163406.1 hypothetical protein [Mycoplasma bradburyae]MDC4182022.1 hypothetical protein [Mycoplasma bradburyae]MDC4184204.1 hypothetical protein [Mycoplasma bradburyae]UTS70447.1 hypothetical protein NMG68_01770 [Mycoplasma bradburyae]